MRSLKLRSNGATQLACLFSLVSFACGGTAQESEGQESGTIEGQVDESGGQNFTSSAAQAEGTVVTAHRVDASGELEAVAAGTAEVSAEGRYAIDVEMQAVAGEKLLIRAEDEASGEFVGKVAVSESFGGEASMTAPPIDSEATVIADLYLDARASGSISADVGPGMFWLAAGGEFAGELAGAGEAEMSAAADATAAAAMSWRAALTHESSGASEQDAKAALDFAAQAEATLASELESGDRRAALEAYSEAVLRAHADAGIRADTVARAAIASAEVMQAYSGELGGEAGAKLTVAAEAHKARTVTQALVARAEAELSGAASAMADAGATLRTEIDAAAEASAGVETAIAEAWASFQADVEAELAAVLETSEAEFELLVEAIEGEAEALASSFAELSGSLTIEGNAEVAVSGLAEFFAAAEGAAEADLGLSGELDAAVGVLAGIVACGA